MSEKQTKIVHLVYGIVLSLVIFAIGVCFIVSCVDIYKSAPVGAFTPESIKTHLISLLIPCIVCVLAIIGGGVLHAVFPEKEEKPRANISDKTILRNLYKKIDLKDSPALFVKVIKSQRTFRHVFFVVAVVNVVINIAGALIYIFTASKLGEADPSSLFSILPIVFKVLAYGIIPFLVAIVYDIFAKFTYEKELEAVRAIVAHNAKNGNPVSEFIDLGAKPCFFKRHKKKLLLALQIVILVVALAFLIVGFITGDINDILTYANNICTGCIGLG